jgi:transcriptional regulator with XRE-family HTH domain
MKDQQELKELADRILDYRAQNNISIQKFANLCKITKVTAFNIEHAKASPSALTVRKILNLIDMEK